MLFRNDKNMNMKRKKIATLLAIFGFMTIASAFMPFSEIVDKWICLAVYVPSAVLTVIFSIILQAHDHREADKGRREIQEANFKAWKDFNEQKYCRTISK